MFQDAEWARHRRHFEPFYALNSERTINLIMTAAGAAARGGGQAGKAGHVQRLGRDG